MPRKRSSKIVQLVGGMLFFGGLGLVLLWVIVRRSDGDRGGDAVLVMIGLGTTVIGAVVKLVGDFSAWWADE